MSTFTIFLPSLKANKGRSYRPEQNRLVMDHHNLSYLYGLYGSTVMKAEDGESLLVKVDPELANAFDFLEPIAGDVPIAVDLAKVITVDENDGFGAYEELSLKATLLNALMVYWGKDHVPIKSKCQTGKRLADMLEPIFELINVFSFPIASLTTSVINMDKTTQKETSFYLDHATYLLSYPQLEDMTKQKDRSERFLGVGGRAVANRNAEDLMDLGEEGAVIRYGEIDIFCHEEADKGKLISFFIKHSALFEFICEFSVTYHNNESEILTLTQAAHFVNYPLVATKLKQRQMLSFYEHAAKAARNVLIGISQKGDG